MNIFNDYDILYPDLVLDIIRYFDSMKHPGYDKIYPKCILNFCVGQGENAKGALKVNPEIVVSICEKLCSHHILMRIESDNGFGHSNNYIVNRNPDISFESGSMYYNYVNSIVYGFNYIYRVYHNMVVPIVYENQSGDYSIGTGFKFLNGIATAKHCILGAKSIAIKDYSSDELKDKVIFINQNPDVDVAFICVNKKSNNYTYFRDAQIMEDILVMGYPKIPGFTDFLTAEKATISAIAESRIIPTVGEVTAIADNYLSKIKLMLITAKIKGGNSGGPVINSEGFIVGISCQMPAFEGDYDDLGYGVATPISELISAINSTKTLDVSKINFRNFD